MLGWFKKKFGKKTTEPVAVEPEVSQEVVAEEIEVPAALAGQQEPVEEQPSTTETIALQPEVIEPPNEVAEEPPAEAPVFVESVVESTVEVVELGLPEDEIDAVVDDGGGEIDLPQALVEEPENLEPVLPLAEAQPEVDAEPLHLVHPIDFVEPTIIPEQVVIEEPSSSDLPSEETVAESEDEAVVSPEPEAIAEMVPEVEMIAEDGELDASDQAVLDEEDLLLEETESEDGHVNTGDGISPAVPLAVSASRTQEKPKSKSMFRRLQERLGKTKDSLVYRLDRLFLGKKEIDQDLFEQLEEILITSDLGVATTMELLDKARKKVKRDQLSDPQALKTIIRDQILTYIEATEQPAELVMPEEGPFVIMVVGVNGVGKTTTIGKIAAKFVRAGQSVLLVAGDTFRAAAINQLKIWGERVGVEVIAQNPGSDPSSVVFDGLEYGVAHGYDVILIDTAGRLHTSVNLMEELKKIKRVIGKKMEGAPHEIMLVLDATTGQNGISQAKLFNEAVGVSGLALTKLDGTAKGGIVANVCREIKIPVRFIGIGEQVDDLRDFDAREFVDALFAQQSG
jgi:fused signal recognition particle receptor